MSTTDTINLDRALDFFISCAADFFEIEELIFEEFDGSDEPIEFGEKIFAELTSKKLQKLFILKEKYRKLYKEHHDTFPGKEKEEAETPSPAQMHRLLKQAEILNELFWTAICKEHPELSGIPYDELNIRQGWKICIQR